MNEIDKLRKKMNSLQANYDHFCRRVREERQIVRETKHLLSKAHKAQEFIQHVAQTVQLQAHTKIAVIVSKCLAAIFPNPYEFKIEFDKKRGKTEARPVFVRNGNERKPRNVGGSVIDVAAFALRLANLALAHPQRRLLAILDEPFRFLDPSNTKRISLMLETLAKEMSVQFVMTTNDPRLVVGNVIELG